MHANRRVCRPAHPRRGGTVERVAPHSISRDSPAQRRGRLVLTIVGGVALWLFTLLFATASECSTPLGAAHRSGFTHAFCDDPAPTPAHFAVNLLGLVLPVAGITLAAYGAGTGRHWLISRGAALVVLPVLVAWVLAAHLD